MRHVGLAIIVLAGLFGGCGFMAFRMGVSVCREDNAEATIKVQQVVQESDRLIRETVLGTGHRANLDWLLSTHRRAD